MAKQIKLMAEYRAFPLWWNDDGKVKRNIQPHELALSLEMVSLLQKWQQIYESQMNWANPKESRFFTPPEVEAFEEEGVKLWLLLRQQLSPMYEVVYFSEKLQQTIIMPPESARYKGKFKSDEKAEAVKRLAA